MTTSVSGAVATDFGFSPLFTRNWLHRLIHGVKPAFGDRVVADASASGYNTASVYML
jgi:hypothetical protein